jgi:hypothetical protein
VQPGQIRRQEVLGTLATYEVIGVDGDSVRVRVVEVPGLAQGLELWLTMKAICEMRVVPEPGEERITKPDKDQPSVLKTRSGARLA